MLFDWQHKLACLSQNRVVWQCCICQTTCLQNVCFMPSVKQGIVVLEEYLHWCKYVQVRKRGNTVCGVVPQGALLAGGWGLCLAVCVTLGPTDPHCSVPCKKHFTTLNLEAVWWSQARQNLTPQCLVMHKSQMYLNTNSHVCFCKVKLYWISSEAKASQRCEALQQWKPSEDPHGPSAADCILWLLCRTSHNTCKTAAGKWRCQTELQLDALHSSTSETQQWSVSVTQDWTHSIW